MNDEMIDILKAYDYIIKLVIKQLESDDKSNNLYYIGKVALLIAYETYEKHKNKYNSFENYAYDTIYHHLLNEKMYMNKKRKLVL